MSNIIDTANILLTLFAKKINLFSQCKRFYRQFKIEKLRKLGWYEDDISNVPAIFIGGAPRSGTTLLREVLNRHSHLVAGPEFGFFAFDIIDTKILSLCFAIDQKEIIQMIKENKNRVQFVENFYEKFRKQERKARWVDKTPANVLATGIILKSFPNCKFIHIIRDGRDIACSLRAHPSEKIIKGKIVSVKTQNPIDQCIQKWVEYVSAGLTYKSHPRCLTIYYEKLVKDFENELRKICDFLNEPFEKNMLKKSDSEDRPWTRFARFNNPVVTDSIYKTSIGKWKSEMKLEKRKIFISIAGELLIALGYVADHKWIYN